MQVIVRMLKAGLKPDVVIYDALLAVCVGVAQVSDFTPAVTLHPIPVSGFTPPPTLVPFLRRARPPHRRAASRRAARRSQRTGSA